LGDGKPVAKLLRRLVASSQDDDWQFGERLGPIVTSVHDALCETTTPMTESDCAALAAALRGGFENRGYAQVPDSGKLANLFVAMHAQGDAQEQFEQFRRDVDSDVRRNLFDAGPTGDLWKIGARLNSPATAENFASRRDFVAAVFGDLSEDRWIDWNMEKSAVLRRDSDQGVFGSIVAAGLLTEDELKTEGVSLVEGLAKPQTPAAGLAAWLQSAKSYERAVEAWCLALTPVAPPKTEGGTTKGVGDAKRKLTPVETSWRLGLVTSLFELGRTDEVAAAWKELDEFEIPKSMRESIQKLREKTQTDAKPADSPKAEKANPDAERDTGEGKEAAA
jgi:hypothetical protein